MILPASLAVLAYLLAERRDESARTPVRRRRRAASGIAAGYKQVAVFDGAAIAAMILDHARAAAPRPRAPSLPVSRAAIAFAALFLASGAFPQYWYAVAGSLRLYAELGPAQSPFVRFIGFLPRSWRARGSSAAVSLAAKSASACFPWLCLGFAIAGATSSSFPFPHYLHGGVSTRSSSSPTRLARNAMTLARSRSPSAGARRGRVWPVFAFAYKDRPQLDPLDYYRTFVQHRYGTMSYDDCRPLRRQGLHRPRHRHGYQSRWRRDHASATSRAAPGSTPMPTSRTLRATTRRSWATIRR